MKQNAKLTVFLREKTIKVKKILTIFTLLLAISMQVNASVAVQKNVISIKEQNISLADLIFKIGEEMDAKFIFNYDDLDEFKGLNVETSGTIEEILDHLLKDKGLTYKVNKNSYVIRKAKPQPQKRTTKQSEKVKIKGLVTDDSGEPIPFASVCFAGTTHGCVAALDGKFELEMDADPNAKLVVSCIGFETVELPIGDKREFKVQLKSASEGLEEVVVTGYQTISKERATGSFGKIKSEELEATLNTSVADQLEGRVQGLLVHNDKIQIRGTSTIFGNKEPLVVVDDFPLANVKELDNINPDDIDNVVVLKDAAAASIWGVRASNGVIVITTKKGSAKKEDFFDVEFSAKYTINSKVDLSDLNLANAEQMIDLEREAILDRNWADYASEEYDFTNMTYTAENYSRAQEIILNAQKNAATAGSLNESELAAMNTQLAGLAKNNLRKEYEKYLFQRQATQRYNLAVLGKSKGADYRFSVLYETNKGQKVGEQSDKINVNTNTNLKLSEKSKLKINFIGTYEQNKNNGFYTPYSWIKPYERIKDENGNKLPIYYGAPQHHKTHFVSKGFRNWDKYLIDELDDNNNKTKSVFVRLNVGYDYKIMDGLTFNSQLMGSTSNISSDNLSKANSYEVRDMYNRYSNIETTPWGAEMLNTLLPKGGRLINNENKRYMWSFRNQVNFDRDIAEDHRINVLVGTEINSETIENKQHLKIGYDPRTLTYKNDFDWTSVKFVNDYSGQLVGTGPLYKEEYEKDRFASFYGNMGYHFSNRYSVSLSGRMDKSNLFGASADYKKNILWSTGLAWNIHNEEFFNSKIINRLTFRGTYGVNGNIDKSTSPLMTIYSGLSFITGERASYILNPPNKWLRWERTKVTNIGIDFALMNNKIGGSIEFYNKKSIDLLGNAKVDYTYGFTRAKVNTASMYNRGIDANLNFVPVASKFRWDISLNFSYNYNKVTKVELAENSSSSYLNGEPIQGLSINHLHAYRWAGLSNTGLAQVYNTNGEKVDYRTQLTDPEAVKLAGVTVPKYYGGLQQRFAYKRWAAAINFNYGFGHKMRLATPSYYTGFGSNTDKRIAKRWRKAGDELRTDIPVMPNTRVDAQDSYRAGLFGKSTANVVDASYIQCRNINLSYKFNKALSFSNLEIMLQANNLWMWTANDAGVDPLVGAGIWSTPKSFTFAIRGRF